MHEAASMNGRRGALEGTDERVGHWVDSWMDKRQDELMTGWWMDDG